MAGSSIKVLLSIINWENNKATNDCLQSIGNIPKSLQPDIVVIDNGSSETLEIRGEVKASLRSLEIVLNPSNEGFAGGHNHNIRKAHSEKYDYIFLLNNDSLVIDDKLFDKLMNALELNERALAAAPTVLKQTNPDVIWYGGGQLSLITSRVGHLRVGESTKNLPDTPQSVSFLTGCCIAINLKRASLEQLLLPEEYFVYWEDTEWCSRAVKSGFKLLWVPDAQLMHHVSDSLGIRSPHYIYYNIRNHLLFINRNIPRIYWPISLLRVLMIIVKYKLNILFRYDASRLSALKALWWGWADGLSSKKGKLRRSL